MTVIQILTLALTLLGIFAASWFNNSRVGDVSARIGDVNNRISDVSKTLQDRITDTRDVLRAELKAETGSIRSEMKAEFSDLRHLIEKNHDVVLRMLADHEPRLNKLEERK